MHTILYSLFICQCKKIFVVCLYWMCNATVHICLYVCECSVCKSLFSCLYIHNSTSVEYDNEYFIVPAWTCTYQWFHSLVAYLCNNHSIVWWLTLGLGKGSLLRHTAACLNFNHCTVTSFLLFQKSLPVFLSSCIIERSEG